MERWEIYRHTSIRSGKSYIGVTKRTTALRWAEHCRDAENMSDTHFHRAIRLYGVDNWEHKILVDDIDNYEEAMAMEKYYIKHLDTFENGYNSTVGGEGVVLGEPELYTFYNKELDVTEITTIAGLSSKYGLHQGYIRYVTQKKRLHCRGWFLWVGSAGNYDTDPVYTFEHRKHGVVTATLKEMVDTYGMSKGNLHGVATSRRNHTNGWTLEGNLHLLSKKKKAHNAKEVEKYDIDGNTICVYSSIVQAAADCKVSESVVRDRCTGNTKGLYNYQGFRFKNNKGNK